MAAVLHAGRRYLVEDAADDAGMTVEVAGDGKAWALEGAPASIHRFMAELGARNSLFARLLADCIEEGMAPGQVRTWRFPAWEWGEMPDYDGLGNWDDDEDDEPAPASSTISAEETTQS